MEVFILKLSGQGDLEYKVVDRETYEWITGPSGRPEGNPTSWEDPFVPDSQKAVGAGVRITSGSWENDRALEARSLSRYEHISIFSEDTPGLIAELAGQMGDEVAGYWEGYIY